MMEPNEMDVGMLDELPTEAESKASALSKNRNRKALLRDVKDLESQLQGAQDTIAEMTEALAWIAAEAKVGFPSASFHAIHERARSVLPAEGQNDG